MSRSARSVLCAFTLATAVGCGEDDGPGPQGPPLDPPPDAACAPGELLLASGSCLPAGMQESGCPAGEMALEGGGCRRAGIPPEACAAGFVAEDDGCSPVLPPSACPAGSMAVPGDAKCREVAPCGDAPWGDIPRAVDTQHVDGAYAGGDSDGSAQRPWTTITAGIEAAAPDAVVAVAAGTYAEVVEISAQPVRLWGRCPELVEIAGNSAESIASLEILAEGANGAEVRDLAITNPTLGVFASGAQAVLLDRVWIHDTGAVGLYTDDSFGETEVTLHASLVEGSGAQGVLTFATRTVVDASVVRGTGSSPLSPTHAGIAATEDPRLGLQPWLTVRGSMVERNDDIGIVAYGCRGDIEGSVVADQLVGPSESDRYGIGFVTGPTGSPATGKVVSSFVARNQHGGVIVDASDAVIESTVVRGSIVADDGTRGIGVLGQSEPEHRVTLELRTCLVDDNREVGVFGSSADVSIEGTIVRTTSLEDATLLGSGVVIQSDAAVGGRGVAAVRGSLLLDNEEGAVAGGADLVLEGTVIRGAARAGDAVGLVAHDAETLARASITARSSIVENSTGAGLLVIGADALVEACIVRDTHEDPADGFFGRGAEIVPDLASGARSKVTVRGSIFAGNLDIGLAVLGAEALIEDTVVADTRARVADGLFGDGVVVARVDPHAAHVDVVRARIERSTRAGVASFGTTASVSGTRFECNAIDLDAENDHAGRAADIDDGGGNACGCSAVEEACQVRTLDVQPPDLATPEK